MSQRGHYRKCCIANQSVTRPASSPGVAKTGVTLNAVADKGPIETKLIAGLGVEADALIEFAVTPPANSSRVACSISGT